jgi:hypothetical protein
LIRGLKQRRVLPTVLASSKIATDNLPLQLVGSDPNGWALIEEAALSYFRLSAIALSVVSLAGVFAVVASAERAASASEWTAIDHLLRPSEQSLHEHLVSVKVSTKGPFALAHLVESGEGSQGWDVLKGSGTHWRDIATISDEGLRCGLVPPPVVSDLHLERYNEGPKPCS